MKIVVSGDTSCLARTLLPRLLEDTRATSVVTLLARSRFYPLFRDPQSLPRSVHEGDVTQVIVAALFGVARAAFNVAPADSPSLRAARRRWHRVSLALPLFVSRTLIHAARTLFGVGPDPTWFKTLHPNLVLHSQRAREVLAWKANYDSVPDCLTSLRPARG